VNLVTSESPAAWPRDVRFTVHASIGMIAGKCNLIRHLSSILATRTSVARPFLSCAPLGLDHLRAVVLV